MESPWELYFVLPNLDLEGVDPLTITNLTLGSSVAAIVPTGDKRVLGIIERFPAAGRLVQAFRDAQGDPVRPAVLIVRADAPRRIRENGEAVFGFRNAIGIAHFLFSKVTSKESGRGGHGWSDTWDIHPTSLGKSGNLVTYSPALYGSWPEPEVYNAMRADYLPNALGPRRADSYLLYALGRAWQQRFGRDGARDTRYARTLFRSLEIAFEASRVGGKHYGSLYEYGNSLALWVSAIEILAAPGPQPRKHPPQPGQRPRMPPYVTKRSVVDLLGKFEWNKSQLRQRAYRVQIEKGKKKSEAVNVVQRIYTRMYLARSRFLHGDRVNVRLLQMRTTARPTLMGLAAYVYWTALRVYLQRRYSPPHFLFGMLDQLTVERSLLAEFGWD